MLEDETEDGLGLGPGLANADDNDEDEDLEPRGRGRSESFVNELEDEEIRLKERDLMDKVRGVAGRAGVPAGPNGMQRVGGMTSYDSMEDFEPIKTQLSQKTLDIVTNLNHTRFNKRALPGTSVELFPQPVVDMSREEAEEEIALEAEAREAAAESRAPEPTSAGSRGRAGVAKGRSSSGARGSSPSSGGFYTASPSSASTIGSLDAASAGTPDPPPQLAEGGALQSRPDVASAATKANESEGRRPSFTGPRGRGGGNGAGSGAGAGAGTAAAVAGRLSRESGSGRSSDSSDSGRSRLVISAKARAVAASSLRSMRHLNPYRKRHGSERKGPPRPSAQAGKALADGADEGGVGATSADAGDDFAIAGAEQAAAHGACSPHGEHDQALDHFDYHVKVLLLGDSGVGKTSLMMRFSDNEFNQNLMSTAGVDFKVRFLEHAERTMGKRIKCQIWDTAGQERFHVITRTYYRGSHGIALVYDVCNEQSFQQINYWMNNIKNHAGPDVFVVLFGNKIDLPARKISYEQGKATADKYGCLFYETSAKCGTNVLQAFEALSMNAVTRIDATKNALAASGAPATSSRRTGVTVDSRAKRPCVIL